MAVIIALAVLHDRLVLAGLRQIATPIGQTTKTISDLLSDDRFDIGEAEHNVGRHDDRPIYPYRRRSRLLPGSKE